MKTLSQSISRTALGCLLFVSLLLAATSSRASVTTVLINEGFGSGSFPPSGWSTDGSGNWHSSSYGKQKSSSESNDGGVNGSAMFDMYNSCDYSTQENFYSPQIDASTYNNAVMAARIPRSVRY